MKELQLQLRQRLSAFGKVLECEERGNIFCIRMLDEYAVEFPGHGHCVKIINEHIGNIFSTVEHFKVSGNLFELTLKKKNMTTLGGSSFVWNGNIQDYNYKETTHCLSELCDKVVVVAGGVDGTYHDLQKYVEANKLKNVTIVELPEDRWNAEHGREKLSYFSNIAIAHLTTDWNIYIQCDEILHEDSFPVIRMAIDQQAEAFLVTRYNLWKDGEHMLNVPQDRKPCSTEVIRLARQRYRCVDDAEQIAAPAHIFGKIDSIEIFHMGFVRNKKKMLVKIKNMLMNVFGWENDKRAENCEEFIPERFFSDNDIIRIPKPLPKFIQAWSDERNKKTTE